MDDSKFKYAYYNQVTPERDIQGSNFTRGQINFKWVNEGHTALKPSKSYFRVRIKLALPSPFDSLPLSRKNDIAPNMFLCDNLFQQMRMKINGVIISEITDYVPQISALERRANYTDSYAIRNSKDLELSHANYFDRLNVMTIDGIDSRKESVEIGQFNDPTVYVGAGFGEPINIFNTGVTIQFVTAPSSIIVAGLPAGIRGRDIFSIDEPINFNDNAERAGRITAITQNTDTQFTISVPNVNADVAAAAYNGIQLRKRAKIHYPIVHKDRDSTYLELIWKPYLGFWRIQDYISGKFHFELTPIVQSALHQYVIESILTSKTSANFTFEVVSMNLYAWTGYTDTPRNGSMELYTMETRMQAQNLTTASLTNKTFEVEPSTYALSLAFQTGDAGNDTRYSKTKFKLPRNQELRLSRYYIQYKGVMLPRVIPDPQYEDEGSANTDYVTQNYYEMLEYTEQTTRKVDYEGIDAWKERGMFFTYEWPILSNASREVMVSTQFNLSTGLSITTDLKAQVLLFCHYTNKFMLSYKNGECIQVSV